MVKTREYNEQYGGIFMNEDFHYNIMQEADRIIFLKDPNGEMQTVNQYLIIKPFIDADAYDIIKPITFDQTSQAITIEAAINTGVSFVKTPVKKLHYPTYETVVCFS